MKPRILVLCAAAALSACSSSSSPTTGASDDGGGSSGGSSGASSSGAGADSGGETGAASSSSGSGTSSGSSSGSGSEGGSEAGLDSGSSSGSDSSSSGSGSGGNTATGSVNGVSLTVAGSLALTGTLALQDGGVAQTLVVGLSSADLSSFCAAAQMYSNTDIASTTTLTVGALVLGSTPVGPGTYTIDSDAGTSTGEGALSQTNATCQDTVHDQATSGTVTITSASSTNVTGTYDLTFAGGSMSGSFSAGVCPITIGNNGDAGADGGAGDGGPNCLQP
jgi:hypothetical protein